MEFWLSFDNFTEKLQLPVNPGVFRVFTGNSNNIVDIVALGELNLIGGERLAEVQLTSFFPRQWAPYCAYRSIPDPYDAVDQIEKWRQSKKPVRLIITDTPVNMACAIEGFEYGEQGGSRDVNYTLSLREYRFVEIRQVTDSVPTGMSAPRPDTKPKPKTYEVRSGDSLYMIAKKIYGEGSKWRDLYADNKSVIGPDANLIKPGQQLVVA
jgi:nucleoid-associated protein YgaU